MKHIIPLVCFAIVSASGVEAQVVPSGGTAPQQEKRDFVFWREMPEVTQVINDVQGKDDEETAARRLVAYHLLDALVNANADRIGELPWRPREQALHRAYTALIWEHTSITARDKRIFDQAERLAADRAFTRPLLKRYFSPAALRDVEPIVSRIETRAQASIAKRANETPPVFPAASQTGQAASQPWRSPPGKPSDRVAVEFVRAKIESYWIRNAEGWTTRLRPTSFGGVVDRSAPEFKQYRNLEFRIEQEALSEAQRLNGIEYRGLAKFPPTPFRYFRSVGDYNARKGWSDWETGYILPITVERRNGEWLIARSELFQGLNPGTATDPQQP